eukprot:4633453-Alexandrium_andersonii.AAC.1
MSASLVGSEMCIRDSGTDQPNMRLIKPLRQQIWLQTETAVIDEVEREQPVLMVPAPRSYR